MKSYQFVQVTKKVVTRFQLNKNKETFYDKWDRYKINSSELSASGRESTFLDVNVSSPEDTD